MFDAMNWTDASVMLHGVLVRADRGQLEATYIVSAGRTGRCLATAHLYRGLHAAADGDHVVRLFVSASWIARCASHNKWSVRLINLNRLIDWCKAEGLYTSPCMRVVRQL